MGLDHGVIRGGAVVSCNGNANGDGGRATKGWERESWGHFGAWREMAGEQVMVGGWRE